MTLASAAQPVLPFAEFLEELRRQGFVIGLDQHLRLQLLLDRLAESCPPERLKTHLCPIFATSPEEQARFHRAFDRFYPAFASATGETGRGDRQSQATESLMPDRRAPETLRRRLLLLLAVAAVLAGLWFWWRSTRKVEPVPGPAPAVDTTTAPQQPSGGDSVDAPTAAIADSAAPPAPAPAPEPETVGESFLSRHGTTMRLLAVLLPIVLFLLNEWRLYRRRRLVVERQRRQKPPFTWPVRLEAPVNPFTVSADLPTAARHLRQREAGKVERLAVEESVSATIAALGFPTFRYKTDTRAPEYLLLIEREAHRDHRARLFQSLAHALEREGVHTTRYFFDGDPRVCYPEEGQHHELLVDIRRRYPGHRLLLFGSGARLVDPLSGRLAPWTTEYLSWSDRALLTPESPSSWGVRELALAQHFVVLPATTAGLMGVVEHFRGPVRPDPQRWEAEDPGPGAPRLDDGDPLPRLRAYLGPRVFRWLCACAVYPELHWDLTLHLGSLPELGPGLITEEHLLRLLRLPWYRQGAIPDELRARLIDELTEAEERAVRQAIVELLECNPAPGDSVSANRYELNLVVQRLALSRRDPKQQAEALKELRGFPRRELVQDFAMVRLLEETPSSRLAVILPRRLRRVFYQGGMAAFGVRPLLRLSLGALVVFYTLMLLISSAGNRRLKDRVEAAIRNVSADALPAGDLTSAETLRRLDSLRGVTAVLGNWNRHGAPVGMRWGLYSGNRLYRHANRVYFARFDSLLYARTAERILENIRNFPPARTDSSDYQWSYNQLKAHLITTTFPDKSTPEFLEPVLLTAWKQGQPIPSDEKIRLARAQFAFFAEELARGKNPLPVPSDSLLVLKARNFLRQFKDGEQIYQIMQAEAAKAGAKSFDFDKTYPTAGQVLTASHVIPAAFTRQGWEYMWNSAFKKPEQYFQGEEWVLGQEKLSENQRYEVVNKIKAKYRDDYARHWRQLLAEARIAPYGGIQDAARKVKVLGSNPSPLMQLINAVSLNTAVDSMFAVTLFQPALVVSPADSSKLIGEQSAPYMKAVQALGTALDAVSAAAPADREGPAQDAKNQVAAAKNAASSIQLAFATVPNGVGPDISRLLQAGLSPIDGLLGKLGPAVVDKPRPLAASLRLTARVTSLAIGETTVWRAVVLDAEGRELADPSLVWRSSAPEIATVSGEGHITALTAGMAEITVQVEGVGQGPLPGPVAFSSSQRVTVTPAAAPPAPTPVSIPGEAVASFSRGRELEDQNALAKAREAYRDALRSYPEYAEAAAGLSRVVLKLRVVDWARHLERRSLEGLLQMYPDMPANERQAWEKLLKNPSVTRISAEPKDVVVEPAGRQQARVRYGLVYTMEVRPAGRQVSVSRYDATFELIRGAWIITAMRGVP